MQDLEIYKENSYKKDLEVLRLHQTLVAKEKDICDLENNSNILRSRVTTAENSLRTQQDTNRDAITALEATIVDLSRKVELAQMERIGINQSSSAHSEVQVSELTKALNTSRAEFFELRKITDQKLFDLESGRTEFELKLRQALQLVEQKETEKTFF